MKILVVEHQENCRVHMLGKALRSAGAELKTVGPGAGRELPETLAECDALIVMGGTPGPSEFDKAPWLKQTHKLVKEALEKNIPYLGVCLGGQILAEAAGGKVNEAKTPEIGIHEVRVNSAGANDPLISVLNTRKEPLEAMQWHFLEVTELPPNAVTLMESDNCEVEAFRVGESAWGLQFHPEANSESAAAWAAEPGADEDLKQHTRKTPEQLVQEVTEKDAELEERWNTLALKWLEIAKQN